MRDIAIKEVMGKLPAAELDISLTTFLEPLMARMPDQRLRRIMPRTSRVILGSESPVVTKMAQTVARTENGMWATAKQFYRLLANKRLDHHDFAAGLYNMSRARSIRNNRPMRLWRLIRSTLRNPTPGS